jgi:hypothetical protein
MINSTKIVILPGSTHLLKILLFAFVFLLVSSSAAAQEDSVAVQSAGQAKEDKPVRNTFESIWIIDNQTVEVPVKGTLEMDILHRFGTVNNGYDDFYGLFAPSNIRLGFNYVPVNNLMVGISLTKQNMAWEGYLKYSILRQTRSNKIPVSVTYFGDIAYDSRDKKNFVYGTDRLSFFNQLIIARKVTNAFSVQVAPSHSHINTVMGYFAAPGEVKGQMKHNHYTVAVSGRLKVTESLALLGNYDQPLTQHPTNNPNPNISFGLEANTSGHAFQVFVGNYYNITPQTNNFFNRNDYREGQFLIGFNITRLWNL